MLVLRIPNVLQAFKRIASIPLNSAGAINYHLSCHAQSPSPTVSQCNWGSKTRFFILQDLLQFRIYELVVADTKPAPDNITLTPMADDPCYLPAPELTSKPVNIDLLIQPLQCENDLTMTHAQHKPSFMVVNTGTHTTTAFCIICIKNAFGHSFYAVQRKTRFDAKCLSKARSNLQTYAFVI